MWAQCGLRRATSKDVGAVEKKPYDDDDDDNNGDCHVDGDKNGDCYGYDSHESSDDEPSPHDELAGYLMKMDPAPAEIDRVIDNLIKKKDDDTTVKDDDTGEKGDDITEKDDDIAEKEKKDDDIAEKEKKDDDIAEMENDEAIHNVTEKMLTAAGRGDEESDQDDKFTFKCLRGATAPNSPEADYLDPVITPAAWTPVLNVLKTLAVGEAAAQGNVAHVGIRFLPLYVARCCVASRCALQSDMLLKYTCATPATPLSRDCWPLCPMARCLTPLASALGLGLAPCLLGLLALARKRQLEPAGRSREHAALDALKQVVGVCWAAVVGRACGGTLDAVGGWGGSGCAQGWLHSLLDATVGVWVMRRVLRYCLLEVQRQVGEDVAKQLASGGQDGSHYFEATGHVRARAYGEQLLVWLFVATFMKVSTTLLILVQDVQFQALARYVLDPLLGARWLGPPFLLVTTGAMWCLQFWLVDEVLVEASGACFFKDGAMSEPLLKQAEAERQRLEELAEELGALREQCELARADQTSAREELRLARGQASARQLDLRRTLSELEAARAAAAAAAASAGLAGLPGGPLSRSRSAGQIAPSPETRWAVG
ncbi:unnamed protein product [Prorocentrum cordatum]|uniref:Uncharacterized protein n=1 Tax=Prorocentrum cordatum TaxID=2364126 RepID=A0ABN9V616_9DINO|nr:unnamed protein product [Polarella glacialis]